MQLRLAASCLALLLALERCHADPEIFFGEDLNTTDNPSTFVQDNLRLDTTPNADGARARFISRILLPTAADWEGLPEGPVPESVVAGALTLGFSGDARIFTLANGVTPPGAPDGLADGAWPVSGTNALSFPALPATGFQVNLGSPQAAVGFYIVDAELGRVRIHLVHTNGSRSTIDLPTQSGQGSGGVAFAGIIDVTQPFSRLEFERTGDDDAFALDRFTFAPPRFVSTPVPGAFAELTEPRVPEGNSGLTTARIDIRISPPPTNQLSWTFRTLDGTARAGEDYVATNGVIRFSAGQTNASVEVHILGDRTVEPDESFTVRFDRENEAQVSALRAQLAASGAGGAVEVSPLATVTILNDDIPQVTGPDIAVLLRAEPAQPAVPAVVTFTLTVTNVGTETAPLVLLTNIAPPNIPWRFISGPNAGTQFTNTFSLTATNLAPGGSLVVAYLASFSAPVSLPNEASATVQGATDPNLGNNLVTLVTPVIVSGDPILDRQTGLFRQVFPLQNNSSTPQPGIRLIVRNLPTGVRLWNASGTLSNGIPFIDFAATLAPGQTVNFILEYYVPNRVRPAGMTFEAAPFGATIPAGSSEGTVITPGLFADNRVGIQFAAVTNGLYAIEYSSVLSTNASDWKRAWPDVFSGANVVQWIDEGPPKTETRPASANVRFYRARLLRVLTNNFPTTVAGTTPAGE